MSPKPLLSVVIPIYFEEDVIDELYARLSKMGASIAGEYRHEIIFVNDGSTDRSLEMLQTIAFRDKNVRILDFSRNFGHQLAITAGTDYASGDAVVVMDGDLQDPPEVVPEMLAKWREGFQVVYGVRKSRKGESWFKLFTAKAFYRVMEKLGDIRLPVESGDFRLMDRSVVNALKEIREENRYIRGLVSWVGYKQFGLAYERDARYAGETKFTLKKMVRFALDGITSFSEKPLRLSIYLGLGVTLLAVALIFWAVIQKVFYPETVIQGWASIVVIILFLGGVQLLSIGVLGEYIGRIYRETKDRPLYIIARKIGFE